MALFPIRSHDAGTRVVSVLIASFLPQRIKADQR